MNRQSSNITASVIERCWPNTFFMRPGLRPRAKYSLQYEWYLFYDNEVNETSGHARRG